MSKFEKLKFTEIIHEDSNTIEYKINDKYVDFETYNKLINDESLFVPHPLPKINKSPENSNNYSSSNDFDNSNYDNLTCKCDECKSLMDIVREIQELDENEAFNLLNGYLEINNTEIKMRAFIETYNTIGNNLTKHSGKLEGQLEAFLEQFEDVEETETEEDYDE